MNVRPRSLSTLTRKATKHCQPLNSLQCVQKEHPFSINQETYGYRDRSNKRALPRIRKSAMMIVSAAAGPTQWPKRSHLPNNLDITIDSGTTFNGVWRDKKVLSRDGPAGSIHLRFLLAVGRQ